MNTSIHLRSYFAQFFLRMRVIFQTKVEEKLKYKFYAQYLFFQKIVPFMR
jgi:hypothetical protein